MDTKKSGKTLLIEGSLGVGKTALIRKLKEIARGYGWHVAKLEPAALYDLKGFHRFILIIRLKCVTVYQSMKFLY